jgi:type III secretion system YscQ/HrcQ family protein
MMSAARPPLVPTLGVWSTSLWNALVSYAGRPLPVATKGAAATFALAEAPEASATCVVIEPVHGPTLYVSWTRFPFKALFDADISVEDLAVLPPALRDALTEGMVSLIWDAIPDHRLGGFAIAGIGRFDQFLDDRRRQQSCWFSLVVQGLSADDVTLLVGCDRVRLLEGLSADSIATQQIHKSAKESLRVNAAFTLGSMPLTISELRSLGPGAVIVLPSVDADSWKLRVQTRIYEFRGNGTGWVFTAWSEIGHAGEQQHIHRGNGSMTPTEDRNEEGGRPPSLPIVIDFELGSKTFSLSEIEGWQAGSVVELDPPSRADGVEVTLRANGQVIGTGDLVRIDDRLAVRLSRLLFAP